MSRLMGVLYDYFRAPGPAAALGAMDRMAGRWAGIEEFGSVGPEPDVLREFLGQLVGLARRARDGGDQLYCWMCL